MIKPEKWGIQSEKRRKRRRRRRVGYERLEPEEEENAGVEAEAETISVPVVGASRSGFLSRLEEVQLCLYLKVYHFFLIQYLSWPINGKIQTLCILVGNNTFAGN
jgi:hypothetical protein